MWLNLILNRIKLNLFKKINDSIKILKDKGIKLNLENKVLVNAGDIAKWHQIIHIIKIMATISEHKKTSSTILSFNFNYLMTLV